LGGVGGWVLADRLEKDPILPPPQRRDRSFPYIEHPTDVSRAVFRYFYRHRGGGLNVGKGATHHQTGGRGRNRRIICGKMTPSLAKWFFAHLMGSGD